MLLPLGMPTFQRQSCSVQCLHVAAMHDLTGQSGAPGVSAILPRVSGSTRHILSVPAVRQVKPCGMHFPCMQVLHHLHVCRYKIMNILNSASMIQTYFGEVQMCVCQGFGHKHICLLPDTLYIQVQ